MDNNWYIDEAMWLYPFILHIIFSFILIIGNKYKTFGKSGEETICFVMLNAPTIFCLSSTKLLLLFLWLMSIYVTYNLFWDIRIYIIQPKEAHFLTATNLSIASMFCGTTLISDNHHENRTWVRLGLELVVCTI